jgi:putative hemolysin
MGVSAMGSVAIQIVLILALILLNGLLAMAEIAIVSARKVRLQNRAEAGSAGARVALELAEQPSRFLSTVQIGITLVGIFTGAIGGATLASHLATSLRQVEALRASADTLSVVIVVALTTYVSLVVGELAPKQIGLSNPEKVATLMARPLAILARITGPFVKLLSLSTTFLLRVLGVGNSDESTVTEEEVRALIGQGTDLGVFEEIEEDMVQQVFRMSDQRVNSLITPRPEIIFLDLDDPDALNREKIVGARHSHIPVARGSLENVQGYVRACDLLAQCLSGQRLDFEQALEPALFVPETTPAFDVLKRFKETGAEIAFAIDEYGGIQGLVTHQDILEAIIGDNREPEDEADPDVVQRPDGSYLIDGMLSAEDFKDLFDLKTLPGEENAAFQTLGGFIMNSLARIPALGDQVESVGLSFEVVDMDGLRVDKVLVRRADSPAPPPGA